MAQHLYKTITANTQVYVGDCYLDGVELSHHSADTILIVYDEPDSTVDAAQKVVTLRTCVEQQDASRMFSNPIKCTGLYVDWTAGVGTVYYHL